MVQGSKVGIEIAYYKLKDLAMATAMREINDDPWGL